MEILKNKQDKKSNASGHLLYHYLPYWPLFLILFIVAVGSAFLYLQLATPVYESTARLMIKDEMKGVESKGLQSMDLLAVNKTIENETEVVQSMTLLTKVADSLGLYAPISEEHKVKSTSAYTTSPIKIFAQDPYKLAPVKQVYFTYNNNSKTVKFSSKEYALNNWVETPYGILKFVENTDYKTAPEASSKLYFSLVEPKNVAENIGRSLKVSTSSKMSSILTLNYLDEVPERAENILNGVVKAYIYTSIDDKNTLAANTMNFLQDRLNSVQKDLVGIERKLQQYKSQQGATDISTQGKLFLENVSSNDQKLSEVSMQVAALDQVEKYVKSKDKSTGIVPSTLGVNDPTLSGLVEKLYTAELDLEKLKRNTGENNPLVMSANDRVEKIKPGILENIQNQRRSLSAMQSNISSTNGSYSSALQTMPEKERQIVDINREHSIKSDIYTFLLQKKEETALSYVSNVSDSKIIDRAESSDDPVSPNKKIVVLTALLVALFSGVGIVLGRETLNRKIMFRKEIESFTDRPVIGEIISQPSKDPALIQYDKRTFIAEQFRMLRMTLSNLGINTTNKRVLITSSISGEGKSFVAANLALSLAMTNKKVVLVDFDLNNPSLSEKLNIVGKKGVTEFLQSTVTPQEIIVKTDMHDNLFYIPAGELPANPSELMMNGRAEELLNYLDANYDYVLVDSAPVVPVTEAYILSPLCDATLYIVRHGYTPKLFVERIDENNKINQLKNVAIVFNGVKSRGFNKNYGYGYGYGYVYGNGSTKKNRTKKALEYPES